MGWLRRLLNATPAEEMKGIHLDFHAPHWELDGKTDFPHLLRALADFLPDDSILYFEGGDPGQTLIDFFDAHAIAEQTHVAIGTILPRPRYYHVPATPENLAKLAKIAESCVDVELAMHFHAYRHGKVLLEWHDVFMQPMLISGELPEDKVKVFADSLGMKMSKLPEA